MNCYHFYNASSISNLCDDSGGVYTSKKIALKTQLQINISTSQPGTLMPKPGSFSLLMLGSSSIRSGSSSIRSGSSSLLKPKSPLLRLGTPSAKRLGSAKVALGNRSHVQQGPLQLNLHLLQPDLFIYFYFFLNLWYKFTLRARLGKYSCKMFLHNVKFS